MNRANHCAACNMIRNGVKTRIALEHTCGREPVDPPYAVIGGGLLKKYNDLEGVKKPKPKPKPKY